MYTNNEIVSMFQLIFSCKFHAYNSCRIHISLRGNTILRTKFYVTINIFKKPKQQFTRYFEHLFCILTYVISQLYSTEETRARVNILSANQKKIKEILSRLYKYSMRPMYPFVENIIRECKANKMQFEARILIYMKFN